MAKLDELGKALQESYKWAVKDGKPIPPKTDFPDFVNKRLKWLSYEAQNNDIHPIFSFMVKLLLDTDPDDEPKMKNDFELGGIQPYMPMTKEYRDWIEDPFAGYFRAQALVVAFIYYTKSVKDPVIYYDSDTNTKR